MSVPHMADLVIDMVDDAMAAYEPDDFALIKDFSTRGDTVDRSGTQSSGKGLPTRWKTRKISRAVRTTSWSPGTLNGVLTMPARLPRTSIPWRPGKGQRSSEIRCPEKRRENDDSELSGWLS